MQEPWKGSRRMSRIIQRAASQEGYSVEFVDMTGKTVAVATMPAGAFRLPTPADRPAVRSLGA